MRGVLQIGLAVFSLGACDVPDDGLGPRGNPTESAGFTDTGSIATGTAIAGVCDAVQLNGTCIEYIGWTEEELQKDCSLGTVTTELCTEADLIGRCLENAGYQFERIVNYYLGAYFTGADGASLQLTCESEPTNIWVAR